MAAQTKIEWADGTFNPWIGCTKISAPCDYCYAEDLAKLRGWASWGNFPRQRTAPSNWRQPLRWNARPELLIGPERAAAGERPFVFSASLADVFDNQVDPAWRADLFELIRQTDNLTWLLLTKRPQQIVAMAREAGGLPPNAALGTSIGVLADVRRNASALLRAGDLLGPAFLFASCEPLLEDIAEELRPYLSKQGKGGICWAIGGGESGRKARPTWTQAACNLRDVSAETGAYFLWKQWGEWREVYGDARMELMLSSVRSHTFDDGSTVWRVGKAAAGRLLDGIEHNERPWVS